MVTFKKLKFKHLRKARELDAKLDEDTSSGEEELIEFAASLVAEWDFLDEDTGDPIPVGETEELSLDQLGELMLLFSEALQGAINIPKPNAGD